jgi:hypothetical protein
MDRQLSASAGRGLPSRSAKVEDRPRLSGLPVQVDGRALSGGRSVVRFRPMKLSWPVEIAAALDHGDESGTP